MDFFAHRCLTVVCSTRLTMYYTTSPERTRKARVSKVFTVNLSGARKGARSWLGDDTGAMKGGRSWLGAG